MSSVSSRHQIMGPAREWDIVESLQAVFDATDRVVLEIRRQAEAEAGDYLERRRREADRRFAAGVAGPTAVGGELLRRAERARAEVEEIERSLKDLLLRLDDRTDAAPPDPGAPEEAILRATQMAVAGSSRSEIETVLRVEYGMRAPGPILDEVLGAGRAELDRRD